MAAAAQVSVGAGNRTSGRMGSGTGGGTDALNAAIDICAFETWKEGRISSACIGARVAKRSEFDTSAQFTIEFKILSMKGYYDLDLELLGFSDILIK